MTTSIYSDPEAQLKFRELLIRVPAGSRVLDVGCDDGSLGELLRTQDCQVVGIETNPQTAEIARSRIDEVVVADVETLDFVKQFGEDSFDVILFSDVLEHLRNPETVLRSCLAILRTGGELIASIPNIAHGSVRLALLGGNFDYQDTGLLDRTHVRFFTRDTAEEIFWASGWYPTAIDVLDKDVLDNTDVIVDTEKVPRSAVDAITSNLESHAYQFIVRAVPLERLDAAANVLTAVHTQRRELRRFRNDLATVRRAMGSIEPPARVGLLLGRASSFIDFARADILQHEISNRADGTEAQIELCGPTDRDTYDSVVWANFIDGDHSEAHSFSTRHDGALISGEISPADLPVIQSLTQSVPTLTIWTGIETSEPEKLAEPLRDAVAAGSLVTVASKALADAVGSDHPVEVPPDYLVLASRWYPFSEVVPAVDSSVLGSILIVTQSDSPLHNRMKGVDSPDIRILLLNEGSIKKFFGSLAAARIVVTDSIPAAFAAASYRSAVVYCGAESDFFPTTTFEDLENPVVHAITFPPEFVAGWQASCEQYLDHIADMVFAASERRTTPLEPSRISDFVLYVETLRVAYERLRVERSSDLAYWGAEIEKLRDQINAVIAWPRNEQELVQHIAGLEAEHERYLEEIAKLQIKARRGSFMNPRKQISSITVGPNDGVALVQRIGELEAERDRYLQEITKLQVKARRGSFFLRLIRKLRTRQNSSGA